MTELQKSLVEYLMYKPSELNSLCNKQANAGYCKHYISELIPYRVGVEIEGGGIVETRTFRNWRTEWLTNSLDYSATHHDKETRLSFVGWKGIIDLKKVCDTLLENFPINTTGGVHIHIDFPIQYNNAKNIKLFNKWLQYFSHRVFNYTGKYNEKEVTKGKSGQISVRSNPNTVEFRAGKCTYSNVQITKWIICCSLLIKAARKNHPFNKELADAVLAI